MKMKLISAMILLSGAFVGAAGAETALWYGQPASKWMEAIPLGNGRLGAMVYGGISDETIALNEISMWSGAPDSTSNDLCGKDGLARMRAAFFADDPETGDSLGQEYLTGRMTSFGTHVPLGDLRISFEHPSADFSAYRRELDLSTATATVSYSCCGVDYIRQYITDYPDDVMAVRISASEPGCVSFTLKADLLRDAATEVSDKGLFFKGSVDFPMHGPGGVDFCGEFRIYPSGGTLSHSDSGATVSGADEALLLIDIRTDYNRADYIEKCVSTIESAARKGWDALWRSHKNDYCALFDRVSLDFGTSPNAGLPTDTRLRLVRAGASDPGFDALFFNYGRYMLISSSRSNGTPLCANLQGIWNDNGACNMPWTCDYHLDINIPQNYWAANRANLAECHLPLFDYIAFLAEHGRETAEKMYGCRGWVAHTVCNAWGYTAPGWGVSWGMNVTGGAWVATHLWSHFLYTRDMDFLRDTAYPLLKSTAEFFVDYMEADPRTGFLVTGPSISPENGYVSPAGNHLSLGMMPTIDRAIVHDIYTACIESARLLGVDGKFRRRLEKDIRRLPPLTVGSDGQVQEWFGDLRRSDPAHRHSSHLLSLFPLGQITREKTPELAAAAEKGLAMQTASPTWEDTEWSTANMLCFHARLKNAEAAHGWLQNLFRVFTRDNLMTVSPAGVAMAEYDIFSFDATEASVAGMCEMLLQSHDGYLDFLPALPASWKSGSVRGLCAEGGLEVDLDWEGGVLTGATVRAKADCTFRVRGSGREYRLRRGEECRL